MSGHSTKLGPPAFRVCFLLLAACAGGLVHAAESASPGSADSPDRHGLMARLQQLPLHFEENAGQVDSRVKFLARGPGYAVFLSPDEAVLTLRHQWEDGRQPEAGFTRSRVAKSARHGRAKEDAESPLRIRLLNASPQPVLEGLDPQPGTANYFIGTDAARWRRGVQMFSRVRYKEVYPGTDLVYYGNQRQLEYDFVLQPGARPGAIAIEFSGARKMTLADDGSLILRLAGTTVRWKKPVAFQEVGGQRVEVAASYRADGSSVVSMQVGKYNPALPLVIDPVLAYSTFIGGDALDQAEAMVVDTNGNAYLTGQSVSMNFPVTNSFRATPAGSTDAFVTKINSNGTALVFSSYLGGSGSDGAASLAIDRAGNIFIAGSTESTNFPTRNAYQTNLSGTTDTTDAFIAKLGPAGTNLLYASYFGGTDIEAAYSVAADTNGNAYMAGVTSSEAGFPRKNAFQPTPGGLDDAFVAKFNTGFTGSLSLVFASQLGGADYEQANAVAVDGSGNVYVGGEVFSQDFTTSSFPTTNAFQTLYVGGGVDGFVTKIASNGAARIFSTYLGGTAEDSIFGLALDSGTNIYLTGQTFSTNFPVLNAAQPASGGAGSFYASDAFVTRLNRTGNSLLYSTYLGGRSYDSAYAIVVGTDSLVYVAGETKSENFPVTGHPLQATNGGGFSDAFVAMLNPTNSGPHSFLYSTYLGGTEGDAAYAVAVDVRGNFYVSGFTASLVDFPLTRGTIQTNGGGGYSDCFVTRFNPAPPLDITRATNRVTLLWPTIPSGFVLQRVPNVTSSNWTAVSVTPVVSNFFNRVVLTNTSVTEFYRLRKL